MLSGRSAHRDCCQTEVPLHGGFVAILTNIMSLRVFVIGLMPVLCYPQSGPESLRKLPTPFETIRDSKQFNAVRLGPGNAINFRTIPPDFRLAAIAMSPDGRYLATAWDSGRIELWDLPSKQRKSEFKSGIGASRLTFSSASDFLVVTALGGKIAFLALPGGEKLRRWKIRLGKSKNDIQEVVLAPNGEWLAYANGERSKVLDLTASRPRVVADLHDAYSVALSQDGTELWTVNRSEMAAFSTAGWRKLSRWPLKSEPSVFSSQFVIRTGAGRDGRPSVAVPSARGS